MLLGRDVLYNAINTGGIRVYRDGAQISAGYLNIGTNSIDVTLSNKFIKIQPADGLLIDPYSPSSMQVSNWTMDELVLEPGECILGCTRERFEIERRCFHLPGDPEYIDIAPMYDGRSTCGRLFLASHITAGYGDVGFQSAWTLELKNMGQYPLKLYAGMRIGQVSFQAVIGGVLNTYNGSYQYQHDGPKAPVLGKDRF